MITKICWSSTQHTAHKLPGVLKLFSTKYLILNTNISCFKRFSDHCKNESLAAKGKKDMFKNQHVRAHWRDPGDAVLANFAFVRIHSAVRYFRYNAISPSQVWYFRGNVSQKDSQFFGLNSNHQIYSWFQSAHIPSLHKHMNIWSVIKCCSKIKVKSKWNSIPWIACLGLKQVFCLNL